MLEHTLLFLFIQLANAESAADFLTDTPQAIEEKIKQPSADKVEVFVPKVKSYDLADPVLAHFFQQWSAVQRAPFEVNQWAELILTREFERAEHLWSTVQRQIPTNLNNAALAAHLYALWNLKLPQTFTEQWILAQSRPGYSTSLSETALELKIKDKFDHWVSENAIYLTEAHRAAVGAQPEREPWLTLQALSALRNPKRAAPLLEKIPADHTFKVKLAQTVALDRIRQNDLTSAAGVLKAHLEPALKLSGNSHEIAKYYLEIARLLYQAGKLSYAEAFYLKIPKGSPEYIAARQEVGWVWLRQGNRESVRGLIKTLEQPVLDNDFQPERLVISSISNLKLCYYADVQKNVTDFIDESRRWNDEIKKAKASADPTLETKRDPFAKWLETAVKKREEELSRVSNLKEVSITAALPAVGIQSHWENIRTELERRVLEVKKARSQEAHRQWRNRELMLTEAVRKMKFVRVELLSQVAQFSGQPKLAVVEPTTLSDSGELNFRYDGVVWPDELFTLRGIAQMRCMKGAKQ